MDYNEYHSRCTADIFTALFDRPRRSEMTDETLYEIVRFRFKEHPEVLERNVTLEYAQEWCERDDTHGEGWFDGYRQM